MQLTPSCWTFLVALLLASAATADDRTTLDQLLNQPPPPTGVVFEIVQGQESALEWALPEVKKNAARLRAAFPNVKLAVVSHGKEEFALLADNAGKYGEVHKQVKSLTQQDDITVHVCGTHASWYDRQPEDFPSYVNVSPAGPAQINDYRALGYAVVRIIKPKT
jgi:intracellular sulfur oxidation DsrE/DsrF family protein